MPALSYQDYVSQIQAALEQSRQAQAAQQAWGQMPWWQQAAAGYGKGASDVLRGDVVQPALWLAGKINQGGGITDPENPSAGTGTVPVSPDAAQQYGEQTEQRDAAYNSLRGMAPKLLAGTGEVTTLLPAAMATGGAADAVLPGAGAGGLLGALRAYAPLSAGGAALGALEPENRAVNALWGAAVPVAGGAVSRAAPAALSAIYRSGLMSPATANILADMPTQLRGYVSAARSYIPKSLLESTEKPRDVIKDVAKKQVTRQPKAALQQVLFQQPSYGGYGGDQPATSGQP